MSVRVRWITVACVILLFGIVAFSLVSFGIASASTTVTYDYHVVAGHGTEPTPPFSAPSPPGFNFTVDPPVFNFGNVTYWGGRTYLYNGLTGSPGLPNGASARVNITNLLGYDINILDLTAEVTGGTPTLDFWFSPANMWFRDWTLVWFDPLDPYNPAAPFDECNYHTGEVRVLHDDDWLTMAVREPCDAPTGPGSLLENDSDGDAAATGHVAPILLANGSTFTEYFGIILFGDVETGTQINGTITLSLTYEYSIPGSPVASFTYAPAEPNVGGTVTFDALASTPEEGTLTDPDSYVWSFGDGTTETGMIVTHKYTTQGNHTVVLNVTNSQGLWDTTSKSVTVVATDDFPWLLVGVAVVVIVVVATVAVLAKRRE